MDPLLSRVREGDRRAYLALLLAPDAARPALAALAAYALELARVPLAVSEPMAGEIRLQWWVEVVRGERDGEAARHPVARPLLEAIVGYGLTRGGLAAMAEARTRDLHADPMDGVADLEDYAGRVASVPIQIACQVLDADAASAAASAAGHAGVYAVLIDRLASLARDRAGGRLFLPADVAMGAWVTSQDLQDPGFADARPDAAAALVREMLGLAASYRERFEADAAVLPARLAPAFAAARGRVATERAIASMGGAVLVAPPEVSPLAEQRAVVTTRGLFRRGPTLLGRLRERLGRPG